MGTSEWIRLTECVVGYLRTQDVISSNLNSYTSFFQNLAGVISQCLKHTSSYTNLLRLDRV